MLTFPVKYLVRKPAVWTRKAKGRFYELLETYWQRAVALHVWAQRCGPVSYTHLYATRPSFSVAQIGELIALCKQCKPDVICMVDNCYGEFTELIEPVNVGADPVSYTHLDVYKRQTPICLPSFW